MNYKVEKDLRLLTSPDIFLASINSNSLLSSPTSEKYINY